MNYPATLGCVSTHHIWCAAAVVQNKRRGLICFAVIWSCSVAAARMSLSTYLVFIEAALRKCSLCQNSKVRWQVLVLLASAHFGAAPAFMGRYSYILKQCDALMLS